MGTQVVGYARYTIFLVRLPVEEDGRRCHVLTNKDRYSEDDDKEDLLQLSCHIIITSKVCIQQQL